MSLGSRRADFERRAAFAPASVCRHAKLSLRYIPVHDFADDRGDGQKVDAWCEFASEIALVETMIRQVANRQAGIWIRRDRDAPRFLKVLAVLDATAITRASFEGVISLVATHPWSADGFKKVASGGSLIPLEAD